MLGLNRLIKNILNGNTRSISTLLQKYQKKKIQRLRFYKEDWEVEKKKTYNHTMIKIKQNWNFNTKTIIDL